ncbi:MAG: hypothetical protein ACFFE5_11880, partial [Candidatus Thorarchaeota archaeon]
MKAYKSQLWIYTDALSKIQGYSAPYAFVLGSKWKYVSNNKTFEGKSCFNRLGRIDYANLDNEYKKVQLVSKELETKLGRVISEFENGLLWEEFKKNYKSGGLLELSYGYSGSDIERGTRVALLKSINTGILNYDDFFNSLNLVGGTAIHVERQDVLSETKRTQTRTNAYKNNRNKKLGPPEI